MNFKNVSMSLGSSMWNFKFIYSSNYRRKYSRNMLKECFSVYGMMWITLRQFFFKFFESNFLQAPKKKPKSKTFKQSKVLIAMQLRKEKILFFEKIKKKFWTSSTKPKNTLNRKYQNESKLFDIETRNWLYFTNYNHCQ